MNTITEVTGELGGLYGKADPILIEKQIHAILLLIALKKSGIDFIFKGGTSPILHFSQLKRFSIDIDIQVKPGTILENYLDKILQNSPFLRYSEDVRVSTSKILKRHFKLYFVSEMYNTIGESYVLLDVVFGDYPFSKLDLKALPPPFNALSEDKEPVLVKTPSTGGIIGDKLTTFAPRTTGIPFYRGQRSMSLEIVKQLFDSGNLFDLEFNANELRAAFYPIAASSIEYRGLEIDQDAILDDSLHLCKVISLRDESSEDFREIMAGIKRFVNFIPDRGFNIMHAIRSAAKVAYLTQLIRMKISEVLRYNEMIDIRQNTIIAQDYSKLNKLKKFDPQAFFYWYHALEQK